MRFALICMHSGIDVWSRYLRMVALSHDCLCNGIAAFNNAALPFSSWELCDRNIIAQDEW